MANYWNSKAPSHAEKESIIPIPAAFFVFYPAGERFMDATIS
jgi:hypothetical protein